MVCNCRWAQWFFCAVDCALYSMIATCWKNSCVSAASLLVFHPGLGWADQSDQTPHALFLGAYSPKSNEIHWNPFKLKIVLSRQVRVHCCYIVYWGATVILSLKYFLVIGHNGFFNNTKNIILLLSKLVLLSRCTHEGGTGTRRRGYKLKW